MGISPIQDGTPRAPLLRVSSSTSLYLRSPPAIISRKREQQALLALLTAPEVQIVHLHGLPGVGKSTLAAALARTINASQFHGGVLWGDLEKFTPGELMQRLLILLNGPEAAVAPQPNVPLRELFWRRLCQHEAGWLLVIDHLSDLRRLQTFLPTNPEQLGTCRILALGNLPHLGLPAIWRLHEMRLTVFSQEQAEVLYSTVLGPDRAAHFAEVLHEICQLLDHNVQLLLASARLFASGTVTPLAYLERLRQQEVHGSHLVDSLANALDPIIAGLSLAQQHVFDCLGVLGEGEWDVSLLAAVALRPAAEIGLDFTALIAAQLIEQRVASTETSEGTPRLSSSPDVTATSRFRTGTLVRSLALRRLQARDAYMLRATQTLLARACLDRAQDHATALRARRTTLGAGGSLLEVGTEDFVRRFRAALASDMPHVRQALHWAAANADWQILRRFAYLPHTELLSGFSANSFDITLRLELATIVEPVVWPPEAPAFVRVPNAVHAADWRVHPHLRPATSDDPVQLTGETHLSLHHEAVPPLCELNWDLTACHVVDGVFRKTRFTDARWLGVRATNLILCDTDIDGCSLYGCDLSDNTWLNVDARHTGLTGSSLQFALLRDVRLNGADLRDVDFFGATLEDVRFVGVNARGTNFTGAVLRNCSLRRADLAGAVFQGAWLDKVDLRGAHLQPGQLDGVASFTDCELDDPFLCPPAKREPGATNPSRRYNEQQLQQAVEHHTPLTDTDLRALRVEHLIGVGVSADWTDLRGSTFVSSTCHLPHISLADANLRGADLHALDLTGANLARVDARAVALQQATLNDAQMAGALLRAARLSGTLLEAAHLDHADLTRADLRKADLRKASLKGANLTQADLRGAQLNAAQLEGANLRGCDLRGATLVEAVLTNADFSDADLSTTEVSDEQLYTTAALSNAKLPGGRQIHRKSLRKPVRLRAGGMRLVRPHPGGRRSPTPLEAAQGCDTIVRIGDRP